MWCVSDVRILIRVSFTCVNWCVRGSLSVTLLRASVSVTALEYVVLARFSWNCSVLRYQSMLLTAWSGQKELSWSHPTSAAPLACCLVTLEWQLPCFCLHYMFTADLCLYCVHSVGFFLNFCIFHCNVAVCIPLSAVSRSVDSQGGHKPGILRISLNMEFCATSGKIIGSRPSDHYFRSVCLFVCLCSFSQPSLIRFRSN